MKKKFKYIGHKYVGESAAKITEARIIVNPNDIVEIDTDKCRIKNITTGAVGRQRNPDMIKGNEEIGTQSMIERWGISNHWEELEETKKEENTKRKPGRPPAKENKED